MTRRPRRLVIKRGDVVAQSSLGHRLIAIVCSLGVMAGYLAMQADSGSGVFNLIWTTTFGSALGLTQALQLAAALILVGAANAVALRAGLWNLGVEGQLFMGAWTATAVAFSPLSLPGPAMGVVMLIAGMLGGAMWSLGPALLKAYFDASELVTTLLLNYVALLWLAYWVNGPWSEGSSSLGAVTSRPVPAGAMFPDFTLGPVTIGLGLIIALLVCAGLWWLFRYTEFGYFAGILGVSQRTAEYAGIDSRRVTIKVLVLSGAVGGLAGVVIQLDTVGRYTTSLSNNTGYMGIAVAVLAATSMIGVVPMGLLLGFLAAAGNGLRIAGVSGDVLIMFTGILLLGAALASALARYHIGFTTPVDNEPSSPDRRNEETPA